MHRRVNNIVWGNPADGAGKGPQLQVRKLETMKRKKFSCGMNMRLAFSTAIYAVPDTLLMDEVFAVTGPSRAEIILR